MDDIINAQHVACSAKSVNMENACNRSDIKRVPFNKHFFTPKSIDYIAALESHTARGEHTLFCESWLKEKIKTPEVLLTPSCTAALELCAILLDLKPGDEVIIPSYTFVSTANAFTARGATAVFIDIHPQTLSLDEAQLTHAITSRTRAIVAVHYAGAACDMNKIMAIAKPHNIVVIEDAAHALFASSHGVALGSMGHLATLSFHETKNISCGQGGALLINDPQFIDRARVAHDKGTNRYAFQRGEVSHYSWVDSGTNGVMSELCAAYLHAQLEQAESITAQRLDAWSRYHTMLAPLESDGLLKRLSLEAGHNGHLYAIFVPEVSQRAPLIAALRQEGIDSAFHYIPLHSSPHGGKVGRAIGTLPVTTERSQTIVRLPMWPGVEEHVPQIVDALQRHLKR